MNVQTEAALINVSRATVYALLAVGAAVGWSSSLSFAESLAFGLAWVWWTVSAVIAMPNRFNVVPKGSQ